MKKRLLCLVAAVIVACSCVIPAAAFDFSGLSHYKPFFDEANSFKYFTALDCGKNSSGSYTYLCF